MIEIEEHGDVSLLRMQRGKGNALNLELLSALAHALDTLEKGGRATVVTGEGSVFCAGVDLPELVAGGAAYVREFLPRMSRVFERLATFPRPVVAAVGGHAIAGGAIVMLACDQRLLAGGSARIGLTEVRVGLPFPIWALEIARFAIPPPHFQTAVSTGRTFLPAEALARGLVDEVLEPERLLERALDVARELSELPAAPFRETKLAARRPMLEAVRRASAHDAHVIDRWCAPDALESVAAFVQKTLRSK